MANTSLLVASVCLAVASLLFAVLAATFDATERTWRPVAAFAGYLLMIPVVVLLVVNMVERPTASTFLVVAILATTVNALSVFLALSDSSFKPSTVAQHSRQVIALTVVSAVLFFIADLVLLCAGRCRTNADNDTSYRDEDGVDAGERRALLGDFGTAAPVLTATPKKGLTPAAATAAEDMTAALREYDAGADRTPDDEGRASRSVEVMGGSSPPPVDPADVPPPATVAAPVAAAARDVQEASARSEYDNIDSDEAAEIEMAATHYNDSYRELMLQMTAPDLEDHAQPFIGFSLTDNVKEGCLVVDGIFEAGPAYQVGVDVDHELVAIAGYPVSFMEDVAPLIYKNCQVGHITTFTMRNEDGESYEASVWVMTAEDRYAGKNYYFNRNAHSIRQSDRLKKTWRPSVDARRGPSIADDEL